MRICIDSIGVSQFKGTGLGSFTLNFLKSLLYMYPQPRYDLLYDNIIPKLAIDENKNATFLDLNINRRDNDYSSIENHITTGKVDIFHSLNNGFSIPKNKKCHYITNVNDLLPVVDSRYVDEKYLEKFNEIFYRTIENSDKIIVMSEFLGEQLKNYFNVPKKKIFVNYPGCSENFNPKNKESCDNILNSKYNIKGDYILHVGSIHIRKNLENLINAFKYINLENKDMKLILVGNYTGKRTAYYEKLKELINILGLTDSVIFTGLVDHEDMPYFYSKASCCVNLSKYEGFPLCSLEAMGCSTPVIWNDVSFFREVFGNAGVAVDANDHEALVDTISKTIFNVTEKQSLLDNQREVCLKYKWERNIINTIRIYESFN
jgi:glycosyltransferase involved in cell wall biosynthesis